MQLGLYLNQHFIQASNTIKLEQQGFVQVLGLPCPSWAFWVPFLLFLPSIWGESA